MLLPRIKQSSSYLYLTFCMFLSGLGGAGWSLLTLYHTPSVLAPWAWKERGGNLPPWPQLRGRVGVGLAVQAPGSKRLLLSRTVPCGPLSPGSAGAAVVCLLYLSSHALCPDSTAGISFLIS